MGQGRIAWTNDVWSFINERESRLGSSAKFSAGDLVREPFVNAP
jgi:hypothetical protein